MRTIRILPFCTGFLAAILLYASAHAENYLTDKVEIQFRSGPGSTHKLIGTLTPGIVVELKKEQGGWCLIVPKEGPFQGKEGWVSKKHVTDKPPATRDMVQLMEENKNLKNTVAQYENEVASLKETISSLEKALEESKAQYAKLQSDASDFLTLKQTHDSLQQTVQALKEEKNKLQDENRRSIYSERTRWFLTGAGVLFFGWLIGILMGRRQRKRDHIISYWR